jgi:hypothetical protein
VRVVMARSIDAPRAPRKASGTERRWISVRE